MAPSLDVSLTPGSLMIARRHVDHLEVELGGSENQVEVTERIEVTEVGAVGGDGLVVGPAQHLGPAKRVLDVLAEQPGKSHAEELVAEEIQKAHRLLFHRVDKPHTVDEFAAARTQRAIKARQILGRTRQGGIEDHQDSALRLGEAQAYRVTLARAALAQQPHTAFRMARDSRL